MRSLKKKSQKSVRIPRARNAHSRQRQRLIDACISALHIYGPSRTTVEKVVAIAKMSPGIVRFYFASKAAMLVASLQFLSVEFEEQLVVPVARLKSRPVAALELMVDLYLDPEIASPRKVSVWYAFWGEASSRQEYYDICGQKDESFAALVRELIGRLIVETGQPQLDPDGIALGLIGVLEMLWQDFAFRTEADIDRATAKRRAMAYLRSIFPGQFVDRTGAVALGATASGAALAWDARPHGAGAGRRLAAWVYANARLFALEREAVFQDSWQFIGHRGQIPAAGDFLTVDLGVERALVLRDAAGDVRAFRNSCPEAPHILNPVRKGRIAIIQCAIHGLQFELDGSRRAAPASLNLTPLDLRLIGDFMLVRSAQRHRSPVGIADAWGEFSPPAGSRPFRSTLRSPQAVASGTAVAADWKLVVEQLLESMSAESRRIEAPGWSTRCYRRLLGSAAHFDWHPRFFAPNHLLYIRPDGIGILQVLPVEAGRCVLLRHQYTLCESDRPARAAAYLASRLTPLSRQSGIALAESTQEGLVTFGHEAAPAAPAVAAFRRQLAMLVPLLAHPRPPDGD